MRNWFTGAAAAAMSLAIAGSAFAAAPLMAKGNVLVGVNYNNAASSSDLSLILQLSADGTILVDEGAAVKYAIIDKEYPNFEKPTFDDSGWTDGVSGIGYADGDDNTTVASGILGVYTRYRFDVANPAAVKSLVLLADYDDAFVAYLNGVEIGRSANMNPGGLAVGTVPPWNYPATAGNVAPDHEASVVAAGKPNAARWSNARVEKFDVAFEAAVTTAVDPKGKTAATWANLKASR